MGEGPAGDPSLLSPEVELLDRHGRLGVDVGKGLKLGLGEVSVSEGLRQGVGCVNNKAKG